MKRPIFYPPCQYLDPNRRDGQGRFYCENHHCNVEASDTSYTSERRLNYKRCAANCPDRRGVTRVPTL